MTPMTKEELIKSIAREILDLDLTHDHAVTKAIELGSAIEMTASRVQSERWDEEERIYEAEYAARADKCAPPVVIFGNSAFDNYVQSVFGAGWGAKA